MTFDQIIGAVGVGIPVITLAWNTGRISQTLIELKNIVKDHESRLRKGGL